MPMLPNQLGLLAEFIKNASCDDIDNECLLRASAGKHYYELFHTVNSFLSSTYEQEYESSGGGTHQALQVCCAILNDKFEDKDFKKLEMKLHVLHGIRVKADYHLDFNFTKGDLLIMETEKKRSYLIIESIINKYSIKSA